MKLYPQYMGNLQCSRRCFSAALIQRSNDVIVANGWNVAQYAALVHMFAHVSGLKVGRFIHFIADAHIYDRHMPFR